MLDNTGDQSDVMSPLIEIGSLLANNLPVFDIFEDEIGGVGIIIESQLGERSNEVIKMSSALCFGAPRGHISDVVAQVL